MNKIDAKHVNFFYGERLLFSIVIFDSDIL